MYTYPKPYMNASQLVQRLIDKGMIVSTPSDAEDTIKKIGYYRLKGYFFPFFDTSTSSFISGTDFNNIIKIYNFDVRLSKLIFGYILKIEVALRARLIESFSPVNEVLALNDPSLFANKINYWKNQGSVSSEIARSGDVFIEHQYDKYEGAVPVWAAVEVTQYGTLSKIIKNLKTGTNTTFARLVDFYKYPNTLGGYTAPSAKCFTSWIQATSMMRNICAHGGRIYNRTITAHPEILNMDAIVPTPQKFGAYQEVLAMKYLRPDDLSWREFKTSLEQLFTEYASVINISKLGFPIDWSSHL